MLHLRSVSVLALSYVAAYLVVLSIPTYAGVTTRIYPESAPGNYTNWIAPSISASGRFTAFESTASNLASGDNNNTYDVFVHDSASSTIECVSVSETGQQATNTSHAPSISADGRCVAFCSYANNLVPNDTNGVEDIFLKDRITGVVERISIATDVSQGNSGSYAPWISADGRYVAFGSMASNLVPGDTNGCGDIFVRDRLSGTTERVSVSSAGQQADGESGCSSCWIYLMQRSVCMSADGRYVAFFSTASNLTSEDANGCSDVFVKDRITGTTERISISTGGGQANGSSYSPSISADGRYVAFDSNAFNLIAGGTNGYRHVFIRDRIAGTTERVSVSTGGAQGNDRSSGASISADGRYIAYDSYASNLVAGDTNATADIFVRDRVTGITERASVSSTDTERIDMSLAPSINEDGRYLAFTSTGGMFNTTVYVRDRWATGTVPGGSGGTEPPPSTGLGSQPSNNTTLSIFNPYDGYTVASRAKGQLHSHYYNDTPDVLKLIGKVVTGGTMFRSLTVNELLCKYGQHRYDFVAVTEHYHCTNLSPSCGVFPLCFSEEVTYDGRYDKKHFLGIGMNPPGSSASHLEERYKPWDPSALSYGRKEVEEFDLSMLNQRVRKIHDWDGFAVAAHPNSLFKKNVLGYEVTFDNRMTDTDIRYARPDAVSIYTSGSLSGGTATDVWDRLLNKRLTAPTSGYKMPVYAITEDDYTPGFKPFLYGFGRTWVVAELDTTAISRDSLLRALKLGRFWSYKSKALHSTTGPVLRLTTNTNAQGKPVISVVSLNGPVDKFIFWRMTPNMGTKPAGFPEGTSAEYTCAGDETYVRVEVIKGDITAYSQPVGITWQWSSSWATPLSQTGISAAGLTETGSNVMLTCASLDELPSVMPPQGYIGYPYQVSTTSGTYPSGTTFTLSYEGQDVTPYGTSNLAVYRWDAVSGSWIRLTSTIDIGNALVTAPLTQAGLYCISAEVIGDTAAPTVVIHTPSDGSTLAGSTTIGIRANDNVGVLRASFYLDDQSIGVDSTSYDGYTCDYDFSRKPTGQYTLKVQAEDVSGNVGEAQVTVTIISEGVVPAVAITSPATGTTLEGTAIITGTCSDNTLVAGVYIKADGISVGEATVDGSNWTYELDTSHLANGPHNLSAMVMDEDQNTFEQGISVNVSCTTLGSLAAAKNLEDGQQARLSGRVVTLGNPGYEGGFYIEELNRFSGIRIEGRSIPAEGDMVSVSGVMSTVAGERAVVGADVLVLSSSNPLPLPLGLSNVLLGGGPGPYALGITGGSGLQNLGLLVRTWGRVTQIGDGYIYVNDGSDLKDGTYIGAEECVGVRVVCDPVGYAKGDFVEVTGVSSSFETLSDSIARQILTRKAGDIRKLASQ